MSGRPHGVGARLALQRSSKGRFAPPSETAASASGAWSRAKVLARQRAAAAVSARDENVDNDTDGRASAAEELRSERSAKLRLA